MGNKENESPLMSKKLELHKVTTLEALPAKFLRPSKMLSFGKADFLFCFLVLQLGSFPVRGKI